MSILYTIIALPIIFGILVVVHEWGHFIAARLCGIRVDEFSVGMGPLAKTLGKRGDTHYNIRWIPMGGYVKIAGMEPDEEPLIRAAEKIRGQSGADAQTEEPVDTKGLSISDMPFLAENTPDLNETPEQRLRDQTEGFYAHPVWQRALVIFAGPFMSFVLGYVIIAGIFALTGESHPTPVIAQVVPGSEAQKIGLRANDRIVEFNGQPVTDGEELVNSIHSSAGKSVRLVLKRGMESVAVTGTPKSENIDGQNIGALGFMPVVNFVRPKPSQILPDANAVIVDWFHGIGHLFARHKLSEIRKSAGGPIFMVTMTHQAVQEGGASLPVLCAELSLSLALFNLLPIPILDGGHLLLFFVEALRRGKRPTMEQQQNYMLAGLAVIGTLFIFIMFNDILRLRH